jgi:hypothetical protein
VIEPPQMGGYRRANVSAMPRDQNAHGSMM